MIPYDFEYERPSTMQEAVELLRKFGMRARLLAGGTDLVPNMRLRNVKPSLLISLGGIEPAPPQVGPDGFIAIDALTRLAELENSDFVRRTLPIVAESAHAVGGHQIRQMATLGGNLAQDTRCLYYNQEHDFQFSAPCYKRGGSCCYPYPGNRPDTCWSVYMSDLAPALVAVGAEISIDGNGGGRRIAAETLFTGDGLRPLLLSPSEIIASIHVPPVSDGFGWGFHKSTVRGGLEFAMANMAVTLRLEKDGKTCSAARIVVGAVAGGPRRAPAAEHWLAGQVLDLPRLSQAADLASSEVNPLPHHGFTKSYLCDNIRVYLQRTLAVAYERACGNEQ